MAELRFLEARIVLAIDEEQTENADLQLALAFHSACTAAELVLGEDYCASMLLDLSDDTVLLMAAAFKEDGDDA